MELAASAVWLRCKMEDVGANVFVVVCVEKIHAFETLPVSRPHRLMIKTSRCISTFSDAAWLERDGVLIVPTRFICLCTHEPNTAIFRHYSPKMLLKNSYAI